jgi:AcrR family transcriptional regulator
MAVHFFDILWVMTNPGLRELKKARTRRHIADTAAALFAERGYEQVSVGDVARAAEVSEQTVYNYFSTKEQLVTDLDQRIQDTLCQLIRDRPVGTTPAAAIRAYTLQFVDGVRQISEARSHGELGYLATVSPTVHRVFLEMSERQADAVAIAIEETSATDRLSARLAGITIAGIFQIIVRETGERARAGRTPNQIADELAPQIAGLLDDLERSGAYPRPDPPPPR